MIMKKTRHSDQFRADGAGLFWNEKIIRGVSMVVFFFVNKVIFPEGEAKR